jgi:HlyD family secretion protein
MAKRKSNTSLIIILSLVIIALAGFAFWKSKSKPQGEKVAVEKVEPRSITEKVAASGKVFPQTEVKISSDVSGEIVELFVEEGDSVISGQTLAKIDPDAYVSQVERGNAQVNSAKANLANSKAQVSNLTAQKEQIEAQLTNAREIHKRNEQLLKEGVIAEAEFENSLSNLRSLEANLRSALAGIEAAKENVRGADFSVKSAEATLKEIQTSLRRTTIYAPMSGIISNLSVEKGERVVGTIQMTGTEMMRIANLNAMEVRVDVSENDIPRVTLGDIVDIEVDAYLDRIFKGTVTQIANSATGTGAAGAVASLTSDQVTNFEVRINIDPASYQDLITDEKPYPFRPGMTASVEINTSTVQDAISVPIQAVTTREKGAKGENAKVVAAEDGSKPSAQTLVEVVFVCENDTLRMAEVTTGIQDNSYIQILSGLKGDEEVVTAPYTALTRKLTQGMKVQKVKEEDLYKED